MKNYDCIENNIEKIYGYAIKQTYSQEEADELVQEILYIAVRDLSKRRDKSSYFYVSK